MSKYDKNLTDKIKKYLNDLNIIITKDFVYLQDEPLNLMKHLFGIEDTFFEVFDVKYIVRKYVSNTGSGFSIKISDSPLPIYSKYINTELNATILNGYQLNKKLPFKYVVKEPESFKKNYPELQNIIKFVENLQNDV